MTAAEVKETIKSILGDTLAAEIAKLNGSTPSNKEVFELLKEHIGGVVRMQNGVAIPDQRGMKSARLIRGLCHGKGDSTKAAEWAKKNYPEDEGLAKALTIAGDGAGYIMPTEYSTDLIEFLRPMVAVRKLNPIVIPMDKNTLQIPKLVSGSTATYIGSDDDIVNTKPTFGMLNLVFKKLAALVPVSNDLIRYSAPSADDLVRNDLVQGMAQRENQAFLRDNGTSNTPKGLRYQAASGNIFAANATVNLANVTTDLGKMLLKLLENNVPMIRPGWIFAPRTMIYLMTVRDGNGNFAFKDEMSRGTLWGYPFAITTEVPVNLGGGTNESEIYFADFADVVIGESTSVMVDASDTAAYNSGTEVVATFSRDQTVIRAISEHDFGVRRAVSVAVMTAVTWGA
jgi:HK97 family phage major capsid protein